MHILHTINERCWQCRSARVHCASSRVSFFSTSTLYIGRMMCSRKASQLNEPKVRVRVIRCTQHLLRRPYCTQHHAAPKEVATVEPVVLLNHLSSLQGSIAKNNKYFVRRTPLSWLFVLYKTLASW